MGGKNFGGRRIDRAEAEQLFCFLQSEIGQQLKVDCILAGSYRRGKADSGDMDIVIIPSDRDVFDAFCARKFGTLKNGAPRKTGLFDGVQVEFYIANEDNWGSQLQMWTGSMHHNITLRKAAKKLGYSLSQYGFKNLETGHLITCPTEDSVYSFLQMDFVSPEDR